MSGQTANLPHGETWWWRHIPVSHTRLQCIRGRHVLGWPVWNCLYSIGFDLTKTAVSCGSTPKYQEPEKNVNTPPLSNGASGPLPYVNTHMNAYTYTCMLFVLPVEFWMYVWPVAASLLHAPQRSRVLVFTPVYSSLPHRTGMVCVATGVWRKWR